MSSFRIAFVALIAVSISIVIACGGSDSASSSSVSSLQGNWVMEACAVDADGSGSKVTLLSIAGAQAHFLHRSYPTNTCHGTAFVELRVPMQMTLEGDTMKLALGLESMTVLLANVPEELVAQMNRAAMGGIRDWQNNVPRQVSLAAVAASTGQPVQTLRGEFKFSVEGNVLTLKDVAGARTKKLLRL